jgi:hypothetical protein
MWERHELLFVIKYEPFKRNKSALDLSWDLDARNHEVTLLNIKHIRLREKYGKAIFLTKPKLVLDLFSYIENATFKFHNLFDPRDKDLVMRHGEL